MCFCTCLMDRLLWVEINCMFLTCSSAWKCGSKWMYLGCNCSCHGVMTLSTLLWLNEWILIYLCLFWSIANEFQRIGHLTVGGCLWIQLWSSQSQPYFYLYLRNLISLPNDSREIMQELSFRVKGAWHKIGQAILYHSKICHGYFISFSVMHSFRAKYVPI